MTPIQGYMILAGIYLFIIVEIWAIIWWFRKNDTLLKINIDKNGAILCKNVRARKVTTTGWLYTNSEVRHQKIPIKWWYRYKTVERIKALNDSALRYEKTAYYWMWDVFKHKPYKVNNADLNAMTTESMPIIGIKKVVKAEQKLNGNIDAYSVNRNIPPGARISLNAVSWVSEDRHELYEETKHIDSAKELFAKIVIPVGMMILALAVLIFFPKIYAAIMQEGNAAATGAAKSLAETIKSLTPLG